MVSQKMKNSCILFLLLVFVSIIQAEVLFEAKVYRQGSNKKELLFYHYNTIETKGKQKIITHYYTTPDSTIATIDKVVLENGVFNTASAEFLEVDESGKLYRSEDKLLMQFQKNSKSKEKEIDFPDNLLVGPLFNDYIKANWEKLTSTEMIKFRLPAPEILRTVEFSFQKIDDSPYQKSNSVVFELDATNILLKWLIQPSYFVYDLSSKRLQEIHGNSILKTKVDGKWTKSTNVEIYYQYP